MMTLAAASTDSLPVVLGGGSLLVVSIGFTLALMRQARNQYRDLSNERDAQEERHGVAILTMRDELSRAVATAEAVRRELGGRLAESEQRNRRCDRRTDLLILACRQHGVPIPEEVWKLD